MFNTKTAFSRTKANWKRYPIVEVADMDDYSVVQKYKDNYPYVWIKNESYNILNTFNWNYTPDQETVTCIHSFPLCAETTKRPISWDILKLVPTSVTNETKTHKSPNVASYQKYVVPIYFYSFNDHKAMAKFKKQSAMTETPCHLVSDKKSFNEVLESVSALVTTATPIWLVNLDVRLENLDLMTSKYVNTILYSFGADMYLFDVLHQSTGTCYADRSVALINPSVLMKLSNNKLIHKVTLKHIMPINNKIGYINDVSDPFKAWANAYNTCLILNSANILHLKKQKNKILSTYIGLPDSRVNNYVKAGIQQAEKDWDLETFDFDKFTNWSNILKRFHNWNNKSNSIIPTDKMLTKRLARTLAVYGKDSDEYQKLSSQLGKSSL